MDSLREIQPDIRKEFSNVSDKNSVLHYFHPSRVAVPVIQNVRDIMFHRIGELSIVDETNGFYMMDDSEIPVFLMPPRDQVLQINGATYAGDLSAIKNLNKHSIHTPRSSSREGFSTTGEQPFITAGVKANRAGHGYVNSSFCTKNPRDWNRIVKLTKRMEHVLKKFTPPSVVRAMEMVKEERKFPTMCSNVGEHSAKCKETSFFASVASAKNYCSPAHIDDDFFLCMLTIHTDRKEVMKNMNVAQYFCFPEVGVAIALRPGDMLIFNPRHPHCVSLREIFYEKEDSYCTSFYLKTDIVSGNNNEEELTDREHSLFMKLNDY